MAASVADPGSFGHREMTALLDRRKFHYDKTAATAARRWLLITGYRLLVTDYRLPISFPFCRSEGDFPVQALNMVLKWGGG
jgi:hypothetical protein